MAINYGGYSTRSRPYIGTARVGRTLPVEIVTVTEPYTAGDILMIIADATDQDITITLPSASLYGGRQYHIKRKDASSNSVIISTSDGQNIDGSSSFNISGQYKCYNFIADSYSGNYFVF